MRTFTLVAVSALAIGAYAQDGWKNPRIISASVAERYANQPEKSYQILQKDTSIAFKTTQSINGDLAGVPRIETFGPNGVLTWLEGKPGYVLQLIMPTSVDALDFLVRPRFSRADLEFNLQGIEKALGKKVLVGKNEPIAGRDSLVLRVLDSPDSNTDFQKLWVDRETGITMKQQDWFAGKLTYEREITKIDFKATAESASFEMSPDARIIRGVVSAQALTRVGSLGTSSDFKTDIANINAQIKEPEKPWAGTFDLSGFGYAGTQSREIKNIAASMNNPFAQSQEQGRRRQNQFGNQTRRSVVRNADGSFDVMIIAESAEPAGPNPQLARAMTIEVDANGNRTVTEINPPDGKGQGIEGGAASTRMAGGADANKSKSFPFAQSDFVDAKTGDTVSFLQVSGRDIESSLSNLVLGQPAVVEDQRLQYAKFYNVARPMKLNVLTWKRDNVSYALVSTVLSKNELVEFAVKVKRP